MVLLLTLNSRRHLESQHSERVAQLRCARDEEDKDYTKETRTLKARPA